MHISDEHVHKDVRMYFSSAFLKTIQGPADVVQDNGIKESSDKKNPTKDVGLWPNQKHLCYWL